MYSIGRHSVHGTNLSVVQLLPVQRLKEDVFLHSLCILLTSTQPERRAVTSRLAYTPQCHVIPSKSPLLFYPSSIHISAMLHWVRAHGCLPRVTYMPQCHVMPSKSPWVFDPKTKVSVYIHTAHGGYYEHRQECTNCWRWERASKSIERVVKLCCRYDHI